MRMEARRPIQRRLDGRHHGLDIPGQHLNQIFLQSSWHSLRRRHLRLHTHSRHSLLLLLLLLLLLAVPVLPAIPAVPAVLLLLPCRDLALSALTVQMPLTTLHFANGAVFACETM
jgi:lipopolysaccharide export LptBFGC system permease protein LptF